jgi:hypothetical protein
LQPQPSQLSLPRRKKIPLPNLLPQHQQHQQHQHLLPSLLKRKQLTPSKATPRKSLLRSNPIRAVTISTANGDEVELEFDDDIMPNSRRPTVVKSDFDKDDDEELSLPIRLRLLQARLAALERYRQIWGC